MANHKTADGIGSIVDNIEMKNIKSNNPADPFLFQPSPPHVCKDGGCLHSVAQSGDASKFSRFLSSIKGNTGEVNVVDEHGRSALHWLNSIRCSCDSCLNEAEECTKCLLSTWDQVDINCQDSEGNTPLHLAVQYGSTKCANLLLDNGADVSIKNNNGQEPLVLIAQDSPEIMVSVLNRAVHVDKFYPNSKDCVLRLDFCAVMGYPDPKKASDTPYNRELSLLNHVLSTSKASRQMILTHPLVVLFLDQKWRRVRKYYSLLFFCYLFWLLAYTSFIIKVYLVSCPCEYFSKKVANSESTTTPNKIFQEFGDDEKDGETNRCHLETGFTFDACVVILLTLVMTMNEVLKIITMPRLYLKNKLNFGSWVLIFMVTLTTGPVIMEKNSKLEPWQYQAAALAIFLSWAFILRQLGTFPSLGRYVEILGHVLKNFGLSMLTFSSLFMAFALSFNILFPGTETFSHFFFAILKCIVMFTGEVDYQDMFYDKEKDATTGPIVGHILYAAFVLIVTIVLMNLLVGLTVSDIQALQKEAELTRVFRQISEMLSLESALFSNTLPRPLKRFFQGKISVTGHSRNDSSEATKERCEESEPLLQNSMLIRPNDPSEKLVSEPLKEAMLRIAIGNYHRTKLRNPS